MKCPKCGTTNEVEAIVCSECGASLKKETKISKEKITGAIKSFNYKKVLNFIINPYKAYKENEKDLVNTKKCLIFSGLIIGITTLINLIKTMWKAVKVTHYTSFLATEKTTEFIWSNLKNINYFKEIFNNIAIYAGILAGIAAIYYIASLVIKKEISFMKTLSIVNVVIIPILLSSLIVAPLFGMVTHYLSMGVSTLASVLSIGTFAVLINENVKCEDNSQTIYLHAICATILVIMYYLISYNVAINSLGSLFR